MRRCCSTLLSDTARPYLLTMAIRTMALLRSCQVLHGREPFSGAREHGVMWLTSRDFAPPAATAPGGGDDGSPAGAFSRAVNWLAVKRTGE